MNAPNDATRAQNIAARPDQSTWLSANAGSGKTRVLTDRVARLLLEEVNPQHILCLTYTKAAASEMQNRLFKRLGAWAMLEDSALRRELSELGYPGEVPGEKLAQARRLFARAIETPGGLKIQTIHAFCASILRRFPLEAGISPRFSEMDDRAAALLRQDVLERMSEGPEQPLVRDLVRHVTDDTALDKLTREISSRARDVLPAENLAEIYRALGLPEGFDEAALLSRCFDGREAELFAELIPALAAGSTMDQGAAKKLDRLHGFDLSALPVLESVFLFGSGAKKSEPFSAKLGSFPTNSTQARIAALMPALEALMKRIEAGRDLRHALATARQTSALHRFAGAFLKRYEAEKQARGWLDFDDLINRARTLLNDPTVAAWVLYRLDGGIDHILVDEAQDTSPAQWNVIERLAQEFTSGAGARPDVFRTIFVVGDKKQSIYSFQGADPQEFDRMRAEFTERLRDTPNPLHPLMLEYSFRSSEAVLGLVDQTFAGQEAAGFAPDQSHKAFFGAMPGRVDLWPVVDRPERAETGDWHDPVDLVGPDEPASVLARNIARHIVETLKSGRIPVKQGRNGSFAMRPVHPGDFLILVQRRTHLFHAIIRECKLLGLPIAGADRLRIGGELAVRDIAALLQFLSTPEDDLSLAVALRSPLFGWSEQDLFSLAHDRPGYLWEALRKSAADHPDTLRILDDLRRQTDYLRPYDLIERILTRHDGRRRLLARLGREAEDGIDALLAQALAFEQNAIPSLTGFLVWMETEDIEIKRQMEAAGRQVRVMTVHGAKGLEAPIVILPDSGERRFSVKDHLVGDTPMFWKPKADDTPAAIQAILDAKIDRERKERERLLYVAMTRAEKWLIVAAAGNPGKPGESWYQKVHAALLAQNAAPHAFEFGEGLRLESGNWALSETDLDDSPDKPAAALPEWLTTPAPIARPRIKTLSPSELGGAKALPGEAGLDDEAAKRRGRQVHRLLEILPGHARADWPGLALRLLSGGPDAASEAECGALLAEAGAVLSKPELQHLFVPDALAEVPISASLDALEGRRIHGVIDKLLITDSDVLAIDFKTNAEVPETPGAVPAGLLRQMGAYAAGLSQVFPGRKISTALLWTRTATLMLLPHDLVMDALLDTQMLDAQPSGT